MARLFFAAPAAIFAANFLLIPATTHADPAPPRKIGFIGCLAKAGDTELGAQISDSLEKRLRHDRVPGFEFLPDAVARGRANLKGGPINAQRIVEAGRAIGVDKVIVCLVTYERERAAVVPGATTTTSVSHVETGYEAEEYYTEIPNPDYEPPMEASVPVARAGPVSLSVVFKGPDVPKTIREKHVRFVPLTKTVSKDVTESDPSTEKPGYVRLRAAYLIIDVASGKAEKRDTVGYVNELTPLFDSMENDKDLRRRAADSTTDSLEHSILAKLRSTPVGAK